MDSTGDAAPADELRELTRQLRTQLRRYVSLGAWAAPGGPTAAYVGAAPEGAESAESAEAAVIDDGAAAVDTAAAADPAVAPAASAPAAVSAGDAVAERAAADGFTADDVPHAADAGFDGFDGFAPAREAPAVAAPEPIAAPEPVAARELHDAAEQGEILVPLGRRTLAQIREDLGECTRCKLHTTRRKIVFGVGAEDAPLMFVGEAPGEQEDKRGEPFVGAAGELLDKMIEAMGWTRQTVYIANTTKCLRYDALVQLGDGSWERIGRLVRRRYAGTVMSVDADGTLVAKRVTDWHATPLGDRRVYRLTYEDAKAAGASRVAIQLTGDHEVLTDRGYVAVQDLPLGARIATGHGLGEITREVVYGTLLGDGSLHQKSSMLTFSHSERQADYARFKATLLAELHCSSRETRVAAGGETTYPVVLTRSLAHRALRPIRERFYRPTKRVPAELATSLTPRMVAIWFLDDGHLRVRPPRSPRAEIATCGFPEADLEILIAGLRRLGIDAYALRNRLHFDVEQTRRLSELIAPYVPPSMRYKVCPDIAERVPFDPSRWIGGPPTVTYERAIVEPIEHAGSDKTFFCIDVEDTHNFVTAGGVVHNCRPPGNRNPQPDELAQCTPFLDAQIRAIAPRIIVTLGRPAANHVLHKDAPISTLRGRFHDRAGVKVMPTFHPAYLLREPEKKKDTWADLKLVIAELERLGIKPPRPPRG